MSFGVASRRRPSWKSPEKTARPSLSHQLTSVWPPYPPSRVSHDLGETRARLSLRAVRLFQRTSKYSERWAICMPPSILASCSVRNRLSANARASAGQGVSGGFGFSVEGAPGSLGKSVESHETLPRGSPRRRLGMAETKLDFAEIRLR